MKNQELLILIKGKDETEKAFKSAQQNMQAMEKGSGTLGGSLTSLRSSWLAMTAATAGFVALATHAINEFMKREEAEHALAGAMLNVGDYTKAAHAELVRYAEQLQKTTVFADDVTLATMANLKAYGMNNEELKRATQASMDLAARKRIDLWTASELVGKAFVGETGALIRYGIVIDDNIPRGKKFEAVLKAINEAAGGRAAMELETYTGQWKLLKNEWGEIQEVVGLGLLKVLEGVAVSMGEAASTMDELIARGAEWLSELYKIAAVMGALLPGNMGKTFADLSEGAQKTSDHFMALAGKAEDFADKHWEMMISGQKGIDEALNSHGQKVHIVSAEEQKALDDYTKMHLDAMDRMDKATLDETDYKIYQLNRWHSDAVDVYDKAGKDTTELFQSWSLQRIAILKEEKKKTEETVDYGVEAAKQAAQNMQDAFSTFFLDAMTGKLTSFKDYVIGLFQAMAKTVSNIMSQMLVNALMGTQMKQGGFSGGLIGSLVKGISSLFSPAESINLTGIEFAKGGILSGTWQPIKAFQHGGIADRPTLGMIGEGGGPEAVVPLSDGRYIPVKMAGGGGVNIQVNIINKGSDKKGSVEGVQFDGKKYIIGVILEDYAQGGAIRGLLKG